MLLSLSVDSHISRLSVVDADVDRRFQALKLKTGAEAGAASKSKSKSSSNSNSNSIQVDEELKAVLGDDLSTRFAALKASSSSSSSSAIITTSASLHDVDADDEYDEVEKLIRWAKDAARLDPSPPSNDDDDSSFVNDMTDGRRRRKGN